MAGSRRQIGRGERSCEPGKNAHPGLLVLRSSIRERDVSGLRGHELLSLFEKAKRDFVKIFVLVKLVLVKQKKKLFLLRLKQNGYIKIELY